MLYDLDRLFAALADPTRRAILRRLLQGPALVGELAKLAPTLSLTAVSKHLHKLLQAGLVDSQRLGRASRFSLAPEAFRHADQWLAAYRQPVTLPPETKTPPQPMPKLTAPGPVAILGLSANPPHKGHLLISHALLKRGYSRVWWSIAPEQEFKPASTLLPYIHRHGLSSLLIGRHPAFALLEVESTLQIQNEHNRTYEFFQHLTSLYPGQNFTFVMGADSWAHPTKGFHTWGGFQQTLQHCGVLVIPRPDHQQNLTGCPAAQALDTLKTQAEGVVPPGRWALHPQPVAEISSTSIREQLMAGQTPDGLTPLQLDYIYENHLYTAHAHR